MLHTSLTMWQASNMKATRTQGSEGWGNVAFISCTSRLTPRCAAICTICCDGHDTNACIVHLLETHCHSLCVTINTISAKVTKGCFPPAKNTHSHYYDNFSSFRCCFFDLPYISKSTKPTILWDNWSHSTNLRILMPSIIRLQNWNLVSPSRTFMARVSNTCWEKPGFPSIPENHLYGTENGSVNNNNMYGL